MKNFARVDDKFYLAVPPAKDKAALTQTLREAVNGVVARERLAGPCLLLYGGKPPQTPLLRSGPDTRNLPEDLDAVLFELNLFAAANYGRFRFLFLSLTPLLSGNPDAENSVYLTLLPPDPDAVAELLEEIRRRKAARS